ncbi:hypothetical protein J4772_04095 [Cohnella sp. LGH]|uniref:hypothetical protein n=1 Tax=Cohnella sp. LGH TaxID=1619153 RepID=UPI001ADD3199|nr:hypothetical protein [Cohnella sp. LGH]QTH43625.1 hypothetical protein J4772_04095 [Cohnella sp. LGH]
MIKIGFIDYFLDEWHANQYPTWIEQASGGTMKVAYAYGLRDKDGGLTNDVWCEKMGIERLASIEAVVERSDCLIVLSPDNPEFHEALAELPAMSGKPVYVDKTFAPDRAAAMRIFRKAEQHGTPLFSSSALRFAPEYAEAAGRPIDAICSVGPGRFSNYAVHQIEPVVALMGPEAERVMFIGTEAAPALLIGFSGGRQASIHLLQDSPFRLTVQHSAGSSVSATAEADFFAGFIASLVQFFRTGETPVNSAETIAVVSIIEAGLLAAREPYRWFDLPR